MSSTRNKNNQGDYNLEQNQNTNISEYSLYLNSREQEKIYYPGDGLLIGKIAPTSFSFNSCDIESQLFGIGSTNLVTPKDEVTLDKKDLKSLNIYEKPAVYIPEAFVLNENERPKIMN
jgi:hypothetical protein